MPVGRAVTDGCERVVVILSRPVDYLRTVKRDALIIRLLRSYSLAAEALKNRSKKYNNAIAEIRALAAEGKALILAPDDCCGVDTMTRNDDNIRRLYQKGYAEAQQIHGFL